MKKTFALFLLCLLLGVSGVAAANLSIHNTRDQVEVTVQTPQGDPAAAEGLTATQTSCTSFEDLVWNLTIPLGAPAATETKFHIASDEDDNSLYGLDTEPFALSIGTPCAEISLGGHNTKEDLKHMGNPDILCIYPLVMALADRTPDGTTHRETFTAADYMDYYPIRYAEFHGARTGFLFYLNENVDVYDGLNPISQAMQDFFRVPIDPEDQWELSMTKDSDGSITDISVNPNSATGDYYTCSAVGKDALYFSFSRCNLPGGNGIYRMNLQTLKTGEPAADVGTLTNAFPLPEETVVLTLSLTPDGSTLLLTSSTGDDCTLTVLDAQTMAVRQVLPIPCAPMEMESYDEGITEFPVWDLQTALCREDFLFLTGGHTTHLFTLQPDGTCDHIFSADTPDRLIESDIARMTGCWNGEKLAVGTCTPYSETGLILFVFDRAGTPLYTARYDTSLNHVNPKTEGNSFYGRQVYVSPENMLTLWWE